MFYNAKDILDLFSILNSHNVNYVLTKNLGDDMPYKFKIGKDIDILVHPEYYVKIQYLMHIYGYKVTWHPDNNEGFLYSAHADINMVHPQNGLILHAFAELCVKSLSMNSYVPLDKIIQESIWANKVWDDVNHWWIMDDENILIHLLSKGLFNKHAFSDAYIREIEKRKRFLTNSTARKKLEKIFFKFTDTLIDKVNRGQYGDMFNSYVQFEHY